VVRLGSPSRGFDGASSLDEEGKEVVERGEGEGGAREAEIVGLRRGVELLEDMADEVPGAGRTRLARRKVKNAV